MGSVICVGRDVIAVRMMEKNWFVIHVILDLCFKMEAVQDAQKVTVLNVRKHPNAITVPLAIA